MTQRHIRAWTESVRPDIMKRPPRMIRGIIYSIMHNYMHQNMHYSNYKEMAAKLFNRHVARGWDRATMKWYILEANNKLLRQPITKQQSIIQQQSTATTTEHRINKERLFLHFEYHCCHIPKQQVRAIYDATCRDTFKSKLQIKQLTTAYSRPTNIRETVS